MRFDFNATESIEIEMTGKGLTETIFDRSFRIKLDSQVSIEINDLWVDGHVLNEFLSDLNQLVKSLKGSATLTSESPGELILKLRPIDSLGHFIFELELGVQSYIGSEVYWRKGLNSFNLDSQEITKFCDAFTKEIESKFDA